MIDRRKHIEAVLRLLKTYPVVGIVGARQVGKTTLARTLASRGGRRLAAYYDLEDPADLARLQDPMLALRPLRGLVVIDEIQRLDSLFPVLRVLADRPRKPARFLVLGSAAPEMLRQSSESLAGRIAYHEVGGFTAEETGMGNLQRLWLRGGLPRSYEARSLDESFRWRSGFVRTFLERDLPDLGIATSSTTMRRLWTMIAHYHGQTWNSSEFARSFAVAHTTIQRYLDQLGSALVVRQIPPWHENLSKRQVKALKVYVSDSGVLHALLNLRTQLDLESHPKVGASWEGFVIEQIRTHLQADPRECYFWRTHAGAELDFLVVRGRIRLGFEIKRTVAPKLTPSMRHALEDLKLTRLYVVHAGDQSFPMAKKIDAIAFERILSDLPVLK